MRIFWEETVVWINIKNLLTFFCIVSKVTVRELILDWPYSSCTEYLTEARTISSSLSLLWNAQAPAAICATITISITQKNWKILQNNKKASMLCLPVSLNTRIIASSSLKKVVTVHVECSKISWWFFIWKELYLVSIYFFIDFFHFFNYIHVSWIRLSINN